MPSNPSPAVPAKRLVVCLDGTNNEIGQGLPTNVGKTFELLRLSGADQLGYYDPGIGTLPAPNARGLVERKISVGLELALGRGIRSKLASAYTWLMQHYDHGDPAAGRPRCKIYVFGFSRGAFTARALIGMLNRVGLLRPGSDNLVPYAVRHYTVNQRRYTPERLRRTAEFADAFCWGTEQDPLSAAWPGVANHQDLHAVPIEFAGLWDTVEAIGLPGLPTVDWEGTHTLRNARRVRHAVSIDEWRRAYHEFLTSRPGSNPMSGGVPDTSADVQEAWFPGVHCDVGGTYADDTRLSTTAFQWVLEPVVDEFVLREANSYELACARRTGPTDPVHHHDAAWNLAGRRFREIRPSSWVHDSVRTMLDDPALRYRPKNLPASPVWLPAELHH